MKVKNICVLGGSGFVGHYLVPQLCARDYSVRVLVRRREKAKALIVLPGVDVVESNFFDPLELERQLAGMDAVINLVGILNESKTGRVDKPQARRGDFHDVHIELPRRLVHACASHGVKRLLHMSALGADPNARSAYLRSKGIGEIVVREASMPHKDHENWYLNGPKFVHGYGLATTVFRPSVIFGREDHFLNLIAKLVRHLPVIPLGNPKTQFAPIFVEDVALAFCNALENRATFGRTYDLCGPKRYTFEELVGYVATLNGRKRRIIGLGERASFLQASVFEFLPGKLITRDNHASMQYHAVCDQPIAPELGLVPTALEAVAPKFISGATREAQLQGMRNRARREV